MKIEILGTGCARCNQLESNVRRALEEENLEAEVIKVEDVRAIMSYGIMRTPGLAIDGKVVSAGKVLSPKQIIEIIRA